MTQPLAISNIQTLSSAWPKLAGNGNPLTWVTCSTEKLCVTCTPQKPPYHHCHYEQIRTKFAESRFNCVTSRAIELFTAYIHTSTIESRSAQAPKWPWDNVHAIAAHIMCSLASMNWICCSTIKYHVLTIFFKYIHFQFVSSSDENSSTLHAPIQNAIQAWSGIRW